MSNGEPARALVRGAGRGAEFDIDRDPSYTRTVEAWILETFLDAVTQVLGETGTPVGTWDSDDAPVSSEGVIATIGLTGDLRGVLTLHADMASAGGLLRAMTGGVAIALSGAHADGMRIEAFAELANEVSGRATTLLYDRSVRCDITPPLIFSGSDLHSPSFGAEKPTSRVLRGAFGSLALFLRVQQLRSGGHPEKTS